MASTPRNDYRRAVADDLNEDAADRKLRDRARDAREHATEARRQAEVRIRQEGERRSWVHVLLDTYDRDRRRAGGLLSGGVAFRLFVWALPFSLVLVASLGFLADSTGRTVESLGRDSGLSSRSLPRSRKLSRRRPGIDPSCSRSASDCCSRILEWAPRAQRRQHRRLGARTPRTPADGRREHRVHPGRHDARRDHLIASPLYGGGSGTDLLATAASSP